MWLILPALSWWTLALLSTVTCSTTSDLPPECAAAPNLACVPKCCPEMYTLHDDRKCHNTNTAFRIRLGENSSDYADPGTYVVAYKDPCRAGKYPLDPEVDGHFYLLPNGSLMNSDGILGPQDFCLENLWQKDGAPKMTTFQCFQVNRAEQSSKLHFIFYPVGLLISVPFLVLTVLVYTLIPHLRDLHSKALCCYCSCLAVAYLFLACVQLGGSTYGDNACTALAYIIQFTFMASFFWLNILCIDTFWCIMTITGVLTVFPYPDVPPWQWREDKACWMIICDEGGTQQHNSKQRINRTFLGYSVYGWCFPFILLLVVFFMDLNPTIPSSYVKPNIGVSKCWFSSDEAALHYFYGPIACVLVVNLVLFLVTMVRVIRFNWNPFGRHRIPKQKARMCLFLFLAMGVSWIFEIASWAVGGPHYVWVFTDVLNILQGVVIFCIYVMEPRVKNWVLPELDNILRTKTCCRHVFPISESQLPSPLPDESNTKLTSMEDSFRMCRMDMRR